MTWMQAAACGPNGAIRNPDGTRPTPQQRTQIMHPRRGQTVQADYAKTLCAQCPVRQQCAKYIAALTEEAGIPLPGIWAGTSGRQRRNAKPKPVRPGRPAVCHQCDGTYQAIAYNARYCSVGCAHAAMYHARRRYNQRQRKGNAA